MKYFYKTMADIFVRGPVFFPSIVFIFSGYLYARVFLGHFFPKFYIYFSISDYLSISLGYVEYAIFITTISGLSYFFSLYPLASFFSTPSSFFREHKLLFVITFFILLAVEIWGDISIYYNQHYWLLFESPFLMLIAYLLLSSLGVIKKNTALFFFWCISLYCLSFYLEKIVSQAERDIYKVEHHLQFDFEKIRPIERTMADGYRTIFANSGYYFMLNDDKNMVIYPSQKVDYIEVSLP